MVLPNPLEEFVKQDRKKTKFQTISFPQGAKFLELQEKKIKKQSKKRVVSVNGYNILDSYKAQIGLQSTANQSMSSNQTLIENFDVIYDTSANSLVDEINNSEDKVVQDLITKLNEKFDNYKTAYNAYIKALTEFGKNNANWPNSEIGKKYGGKTVNLGGDIGYITHGGFFKWYNASVLNKQKALDAEVKKYEATVEELNKQISSLQDDLSKFQKNNTVVPECGHDLVPLTMNDEECKQIANRESPYEQPWRIPNCKNAVGSINGTICEADYDCGSAGASNNLNNCGWYDVYKKVVNDFSTDITDTQSKIDDLTSQLEEQQKLLDEAEAARSNNKCWPAQTGESYELSLARPTKEKYNESNPSITGPGVQLSSSELSTPMYTSSRMTADVNCTEGEFTNEEDYNYVLENFLEQYKKDLDKAIEEFDDIKEQIIGTQTNVIEGNTNMQNGKNKDFENTKTIISNKIADSYDKQKQDLDKYENIKERIEEESVQLSNILGMNEDSYLNAASRNQQYLMWTFLAILLVTFAITKSR